MTTLTRDEITKLSPPERLALIGDLWDSIPDPEVPTPPPQRRELERRLASFDQDRGQAVSWEQLKAELAARAVAHAASIAFSPELWSHDFGKIERALSH
jgi:putative addiction module component (TIGR02574 family)